MAAQRPNNDASHQRAAALTSAPHVRLARRSRLLALVLVIVTFAVYFPVLRGGFVFDDDILITGNSMVKASDGLYRFWFTTEAPDYYPLTSSLWWLEWRWWGTNPTGYHVVNVLLHAVNAILVWTILRRLKIPGAWLAGLVFAIHPVNVATVAWISEQKNTLSMLFYALAILLYLQFDETRDWRWYAGSLGAFCLALLSKTAVVMLPVVLWGCVWWTRGRVTRKDVLRNMPFFALSLVMGLVTMWYQYRLPWGKPVPGTDGFAFRLAAAGCAPWFYLGKALWPVNLMTAYPKWQIDTSRWVSYLPGAALIACFLVFWWKRRTWGRPLLFGFGYFVVMLFPVLGLLKQGPYRLTFVADRWNHWQYFSMVGVIALAVAAVDEVRRRAGERRGYWTAAAGTALLMALAATTWSRNCVYAGNETLWRDNVAKNSGAWLAYNNLGNALARAGRVPEAIVQYEQALRINPDLAEAHNNLGNLLMRSGRMPEAREHLERALRIDPNLAEAHNNLGTALAQTGEITDAIAHYQQALRIQPRYAEAHYNLGIALERAGKREDAIAQFEQALRIEPDFAEAHYNLGTVLGQAGRMPEAIEHLEQALRIEPDFAEAHANLGNALAQVGRVPEAVAQYKLALRLKPDFAEARTALARLQARQ
ncbi:MAG: tetratricopeptide repeat protein [Verrucomicrobiia bacterium]